MNCLDGVIITTPNQARSKQSVKQNFAERINCEGAELQNIWFVWLLEVVKCQSLLAVRYRWTAGLRWRLQQIPVHGWYPMIPRNERPHSSSRWLCLCTHTPHYRLLPPSVLHYFVLRSHTQRNQRVEQKSQVLLPHTTTTYYDVVYEVTLFHRFPLSKTLLSPLEKDIRTLLSIRTFAIVWCGRK